MKRSFLGSELKVIPCNYYFFWRKQLQLFYLQFEQNKYFTIDWITKEKQKLKKKKKKGYRLAIMLSCDLNATFVT